ncbi:MAG: 30S ribosomal protein S20 [Planctomycetota bacterium]
MAHSKQAQKRVRTDEQKRIHNRIISSKMRTAIKRVNEACEAGDSAKAQLALKEAMKRVDKCAKRNIVHNNNAARKKSALARKVDSI